MGAGRVRGKVRGIARLLENAIALRRVLRSVHAGCGPVAAFDLANCIQFIQTMSLRSKRSAPAKRRQQGNKAQAAAYAHLKNLILTGQLPGGAAINPGEMGKALGTSRMPVREALFQLESEGLVRFGSNRRPIVTALTPAEIMELFEIRIALEQLALAQAIGHLNQKSFSDLAQQLVRMQRQKNNPQAWLQLHDEFHDLIYVASGMPKLMEEIARLREWIRPYILMYIRAFGEPEIQGFEHSALLEILQQKNPAQAQLAIAKHIRTGASSLVYFLMGRQTSQVLAGKVLSR